MIPTMLVVGSALGLLPRWWPRSLRATALLALVVSAAFGLLVGEPLYGGALALANAAVGIGLGRLVQLAVLRPPAHRHRTA